MAVALVQSASAASSAASPISITPTLGVASTPQNLLVLAVVVSGSSFSITTPAGWTLITFSGNSNNAMELFQLPKNAGGITAVAVTITAVGGGAVASIFEFSGTNNILEAFTANSAGGQASIVNALNLPSVLQVGELTFITVGDNDTGSAATINSTGEFSANTAPAVSTAGVPNVRIANFFATNKGPSTPQLLNGGSLGGATNYMFIIARFQGQNALIGYGASSSEYVSQGGNPAGSLQTPQPQAPGNFFSGSIGVG